MSQITWNTSLSASAVHAAYSFTRQSTQAIPQLKPTVIPTAAAIDQILIQSLGPWSERGWKVLIGLSSAASDYSTVVRLWRNQVESLAEFSSQTEMQLAGLLSDLEAAVKLANPKIEDQLILRSRPIEEQWNGYGRGLLAHAKRLTEEAWISSEAEAVFVQPVLGGFGIAIPSLKKLVIEAVLTNPLAEIPEVVRVLWLLLQLNSEKLEYSQEISFERIGPVSALATLMVALASSEVLELSRCDAAVIQLAIEHWQIAIPERFNIQTILIPWWETYLQTRPKWKIALLALNKMLK